MKQSIRFSNLAGGGLGQRLGQIPIAAYPEPFAEVPANQLDPMGFSTRSLDTNAQVGGARFCPSRSTSF
jgi:hypothetical protein